MDKRYQVFVSSTYRDLQAERGDVIQALLEMDCIPAGMELFPATDESQWELIKKIIDDCDYYIVILGGRYGSTNEEGISYTEKEFDYAASKSVPILVFPIEDPGKILAERTEIDDAAQAKLAAFRQKATANRIVKFWTTPEDLAGKVSRSLSHLTKTQPAEGWIRGRFAGDPQTVLQLKNRVDELQEELKTAATKPPEGIDDLAQSQDLVCIEYDYRDPECSVQRRQTNRPWDEWIAVLGPLMFDECSEDRLKEVLSDFMGGPEATSLSIRGRAFMITEEAFQTVKVQFIALGLIRKSERKRAPSNENAYWSLTPYGANYVTRLKAVRRSAAQSV